MQNEPSEGVAILLVADESEARARLSGALAAEDYYLSTAAIAEAVGGKFPGEPVDVIVGYVLGQPAACLDLLRACGAAYPDAPVILITGGERQDRREFLRAGAFRVLREPVPPSDVLFEIGRALEYRELVRQNQNLQRQVAAQSHLETLIGQSPAMVEVRKRIAMCAASRSPVLIRGEAGTGKELVARIIHHSGPRKNLPFIPVDCQGLSPSLQEIELFGNALRSSGWEGAPKRGVLEAAVGGTVYLEEVAALTPRVQTRLLQTLVTHRIRCPVRHRVIPVDAASWFQAPAI